METLILPHKPQCRICLKTECQKLFSLYESDDDEESPRSMLKKMTGVDLEDKNSLTELPKQICKSCNCELNLSFQFFEKVLRAQSQIKHYLSTKEKKETLKTQTATLEITEAHEIDAAEEKNQDSSITEELVEYLDVEILETSLNTITNNEIEAECSAQTESAVQVETNKVKAYNEINRKRNMEESTTDLVDKTLRVEIERSFVNLSKRGRKTKMETAASNEDQKSHVCEICGNVFAKRGRLTEHLRRHATEAKYICELCDERFVLRESLRRHMYQHLGGKPFRCNFCTRTFFYESVKKAHEAVHDGHKPFVCDKCNKAFAYPHALKNHQLIHDDIKQFSCKYCKKDFRLQHHMKQHEETKAHINAVQAAKLALE